MVDRVIAERRSYSDQADTHHHPYAQLILPIQGSLIVATPHQQVEVDSSRLFFVPPTCEHTFHAHAQNEFLVLDIPRSFVITGTGDRSIPSQDGILQVLNDQWAALKYLLITEAQRPDPTLSNLVRYACQQFNSLTVPQSVAYLHAHYAEAIALHHLATIEGYTPTYYSEWFKTQTGMTVKQYLQKLRIQHAKDLLHETDLPICEVAIAVGYEHHASLTRVFKQVEGVTPGQYREAKT